VELLKWGIFLKAGDDNWIRPKDQDNKKVMKCDILQGDETGCADHHE